jgi:glycosyltransferase involved in cell wall biosynthesis
LKNCIVHISEVDISVESGMGRIEYYWKRAFKNAGYDFLHIGPKEVGKVIHKSLFGYKAYRYFRQLGINPVAFIAHEPVAGFFCKKKAPCFVESHGVERRHWEDERSRHAKKEPLSLKTRIFYPIWRLHTCDRGLKYGHRLLLSNTDDTEYVKDKYKRKDDDIFIFKNGFEHCRDFSGIDAGDFTILFNATWLERKGIFTLIEAATILHKENIPVKYMLIGTGISETEVRDDWPGYLQQYLQIVSSFKKEQECCYLNKAAVFVLPSFYEGQPLSLLQAMANGKCCITTNCCGQKDLIINGKDGLLFEAGDAKALAMLIRQCYFNPALIKQLGSNAQKKLKERSWENVATEVIGYILANVNS